MATDSKGDDHQPKGTPHAGGSAPNAGAGDGDDLHEDSFHGMHRPRCMLGDRLGGGFAPPTKDGFDGGGGHALPFSWNRAPSRRIEGGREALSTLGHAIRRSYAFDEGAIRPMAE